MWFIYFIKNWISIEWKILRLEAEYPKKINAGNRRDVTEEKKKKKTNQISMNQQKKIIKLIMRHSIIISFAAKLF